MNSVQINEMRREGDYIYSLLEQMDSAAINSETLFKLKADDKSIAIESDTNGVGDTIIKKVYLTDTASKHYGDVIRLIEGSIDENFKNILENSLPEFKDVIVIINIEENRSVKGVDICVTPNEVEAIVLLTNYILGTDLSDNVSPVAIGELVYIKYPILVDKLADTSSYEEPEYGYESEYEMDMDEIPEIEDEEEYEFELPSDEDEDEEL